MSELDEILRQVPISQLASQWGVDESEITAATQHALPALLGGLQANAQDPKAADSIVSALSNHGGAVRGLDDIDEHDGQKIVGNIFGGNQDQVVSQLGGLGGSSGLIVSKLMPILAPIVMSWLANKMSGSGGLGGVLGGMLGGGTAAPTTTDAAATTDADSGALFPGGAGSTSAPTQSPTDSAPAAGATGATSSLQDILGSVLGGGASSGGGSDILGGLLGGLLGGGKR
ncbi:hypothetical protein BA895_04075 [Humibacillus sp. DSM 29435]|uniref:DUF937 domain-containing protein n=1 Tax=Humibacillus sp. DSM 29435 TaxID=1869167 RepID=UPI00087258D6|nr:DUF937 domain-containing protein [Humibacillus sp. DSM 29435]OFE16753.1 hypothetical protein BA895_04075 [Humibacillus sp. DSM 29435]